jgi:hypothetical protein
VKRPSPIFIARLPSRQVLLDWGMRPCGGPGCKVLLAPAAPGHFCVRCRRGREVRPRKGGSR